MSCTPHIYRSASAADVRRDPRQRLAQARYMRARQMPARNLNQEIALERLNVSQSESSIRAPCPPPKLDPASPCVGEGGGGTRQYELSEFGLPENEQFQNPAFFRDMDYNFRREALMRFHKMQPRRMDFPRPPCVNDEEDFDLADISAPFLEGSGVSDDLPALFTPGRYNEPQNVNAKVPTPVSSVKFNRAPAVPQQVCPPEVCEEEMQQEEQQRAPSPVQAAPRVCPPDQGRGNAVQKYLEIRQLKKQQQQQQQPQSPQTSARAPRTPTPQLSPLRSPAAFSPVKLDADFMKGDESSGANRSLPKEIRNAIRKKFNISLPLDDLEDDSEPQLVELESERVCQILAPTVNQFSLPNEGLEEMSMPSFASSGRASSPRGPSPRGPSPRGPSPRGPSPCGPLPRGPSPRGPSPCGPLPRGPSPRGPSPARRPVMETPEECLFDMSAPSFAADVSSPARGMPSPRTPRPPSPGMPCPSPRKVSPARPCPSPRGPSPARPCPSPRGPSPARPCPSPQMGKPPSPSPKMPTPRLATPRHITLEEDESLDEFMQMEMLANIPLPTLFSPGGTYQQRISLPPEPEIEMHEECMPQQLVNAGGMNAVEALRRRMPQRADVRPPSPRTPRPQSPRTPRAGVPCPQSPSPRTPQRVVSEGESLDEFEKLERELDCIPCPAPDGNESLDEYERLEREAEAAEAPCPAARPCDNVGEYKIQERIAQAQAAAEAAAAAMPCAPAPRAPSPCPPAPPVEYSKAHARRQFLALKDKRKPISPQPSPPPSPQPSPPPPAPPSPQPSPQIGSPCVALPIHSPRPASPRRAQPCPFSPPGLIKPYSPIKLHDEFIKEPGADESADANRSLPKEIRNAIRKKFNINLPLDDLEDGDEPEAAAADQERVCQIPPPNINEISLPGESLNEMSMPSFADESSYVTPPPRSPARRARTPVSVPDECLFDVSAPSFADPCSPARGPSPRGPSPRGPSPRGPSPRGPSPRGPSPCRPPSPRAQNVAMPCPSPRQARPRPQSPSPKRPSPIAMPCPSPRRPSPKAHSTAMPCPSPRQASPAMPCPSPQRSSPRMPTPRLASPRHISLKDDSLDDFEALEMMAEISLPMLFSPGETYQHNVSVPVEPDIPMPCIAPQPPSMSAVEALRKRMPPRRQQSPRSPRSPRGPSPPAPCPPDPCPLEPIQAEPCPAEPCPAAPCPPEPCPPEPCPINARDRFQMLRNQMAAHQEPPPLSPIREEPSQAEVCAEEEAGGLLQPLMTSQLVITAEQEYFQQELIRPPGERVCDAEKADKSLPKIMRDAIRKKFNISLSIDDDDSAGRSEFREDRQKVCQIVAPNLDDICLPEESLNEMSMPSFADESISVASPPCSPARRVSTPVSAHDECLFDISAPAFSDDVCSPVASPRTPSPRIQSPRVPCPSPRVQSPRQQSPRQQSPRQQSPRQQSPRQQSPRMRSPSPRVARLNDQSLPCLFSPGGTYQHHVSPPAEIDISMPEECIAQPPGGINAVEALRRRMPQRQREPSPGMQSPRTPVQRQPCPRTPGVIPASPRTPRAPIPCPKPRSADSLDEFERLEIELGIEAPCEAPCAPPLAPPCMEDSTDEFERLEREAEAAAAAEVAMPCVPAPRAPSPCPPKPAVEYSKANAAKKYLAMKNRRKSFSPMRKYNAPVEVKAIPRKIRKQLNFDTDEDDICPEPAPCPASPRAATPRAASPPVTPRYSPPRPPQKFDPIVLHDEFLMVEEVGPSDQTGHSVAKDIRNAIRRRFHISLPIDEDEQGEAGSPELDDAQRERICQILAPDINEIELPQESLNEMSMPSIADESSYMATPERSPDMRVQAPMDIPDECLFDMSAPSFSATSFSEDVCPPPRMSTPKVASPPKPCPSPRMGSPRMASPRRMPSPERPCPSPQNVPCPSPRMPTPRLASPRHITLEDDESLDEFMQMEMLANIPLPTLFSPGGTYQQRISLPEEEEAMPEVCIAAQPPPVNVVEQLRSRLPPRTVMRQPAPGMQSPGAGSPYLRTPPPKLPCPKTPGVIPPTPRTPGTRSPCPQPCAPPIMDDSLDEYERLEREAEAEVMPFAPIVRPPSPCAPRPKPPSPRAPAPKEYSKANAARKFLAMQNRRKSFSPIRKYNAPVDFDVKAIPKKIRKQLDFSADDEADAPAPCPPPPCPPSPCPASPQAAAARMSPLRPPAKFSPIVLHDEFLMVEEISPNDQMDRSVSKDIRNAIRRRFHINLPIDDDENVGSPELDDAQRERICQILAPDLNEIELPQESLNEMSMPSFADESPSIASPPQSPVRRVQTPMAITDECLFDMSAPSFADDVCPPSPRTASPRMASPRTPSPRMPSPRMPSPRVASPRQSPAMPCPQVASPRGDMPLPTLFSPGGTYQYNISLPDEVEDIIVDDIPPQPCGMQAVEALRRRMPQRRPVTPPRMQTPQSPVLRTPGARPCPATPGVIPPTPRTPRPAPCMEDSVDEFERLEIELDAAPCAPPPAAPCMEDSVDEFERLERELDAAPCAPPPAAPCMEDSVDEFERLERELALADAPCMEESIDEFERLEREVEQAPCPAARPYDNECEYNIQERIAQAEAAAEAAAAAAEEARPCPPMPREPSPCAPPPVEEFTKANARRKFLAMRNRRKSFSPVPTYNAPRIDRKAIPRKIRKQLDFSNDEEPGMGSPCAPAPCPASPGPVAARPAPCPFSPPKSPVCAPSKFAPIVLHDEFMIVEEVAPSNQMDRSVSKDIRNAIRRRFHVSLPGEEDEVCGPSAIDEVQRERICQILAPDLSRISLPQESLNEMSMPSYADESSHMATPPRSPPRRVRTPMSMPDECLLDMSAPSFADDVCSPPSPKRPSPGMPCPQRGSPRMPSPRMASPQTPCPQIASPRRPSPRMASPKRPSPCPQQPSPRTPCPQPPSPRMPCPESPKMPTPRLASPRHISLEDESLGEFEQLEAMADIPLPMLFSPKGTYQCKVSIPDEADIPMADECIAQAPSGRINAAEELRRRMGPPKRQATPPCPASPRTMAPCPSAQRPAAARPIGPCPSQQDVCPPGSPRTRLAQLRTNMIAPEAMPQQQEPCYSPAREPSIREQVDDEYEMDEEAQAMQNELNNAFLMLERRRQETVSVTDMPAQRGDQDLPEDIREAIRKRYNVALNASDSVQMSEVSEGSILNMDDMETDDVFGADQVYEPSPRYLPSPRRQPSPQQQVAQNQPCPGQQVAQYQPSPRQQARFTPSPRTPGVKITHSVHSLTRASDGSILSVRRASRTSIPDRRGFESMENYMPFDEQIRSPPRASPSQESNMYENVQYNDRPRLGASYQEQRPNNADCARRNQSY